MNTKWSEFGNKPVIGTSRNLQEEYNKTQQHSRRKLLNFKPGEKVLVRRGKNDKFSHCATIVNESGYGAFIVKFMNGRQAVVNQRFIKSYSWESSSSDIN